MEKIKQFMEIIGNQWVKLKSFLGMCSHDYILVIGYRNEKIEYEKKCCYCGKLKPKS